MRSLRAVLRLIAFLVWSAAGWLAAVLSHPLWWAVPSLRAPLHEGVARTWARGVASIVGLRVRVEGTPPRAPFVLVSNHLGYLDIVTVMAHAPGVFVSRGDVAGWPVLGRLAKAADTIFIDRALRRDVVRVNTLIDGVLQGGLGLIMFPESTSSSGDEVLPFRSSLLEPAVALGRPVHWAALHYHTPAGSPPAREAVAWWGDMTFLDHFWGLLCLPRCHAVLRFGGEPVTAGARHERARALWEQVSRAHAEIAGHAPPTHVGRAAAESGGGDHRSATVAGQRGATAATHAGEPAAPAPTRAAKDVDPTFTGR